MTYEECAAELVELYGPPLGRCAEYTEAFARAFPELQRVRGFVTLTTGLRRSHWWLVKPDGTIFDPTASQFSEEFFGHAGVAFYEPLDENNPEPTGKCPNCGEYCYDGGTCCSKKCHTEYAAYCMER